MSTAGSLSLDGHVNYSSLLGYPVAGVPATGSSSFVLSADYYKIQCQKSWHIKINTSGPVVEDWYTPLGLSSFNYNVGFPQREWVVYRSCQAACVL